MDESVRIFLLERTIDLVSYCDIEKLVIKDIQYKFPGMFYFTEHGFLDYKIYLVALNYKDQVYPRLKLQVDNKSRIYIFNEVEITGKEVVLGERSAGYKYLGTNCIGDKNLLSGFVFYNLRLEFLNLKRFLTYKYKLKK
jgi:hypothetical protein